MRHIHHSIVSKHLATRGNYKIQHTTPPHISSSEEIIPRFIRRARAQLRTNISLFLISYLYKVNAKSHPSPLCPFCNTPHLHNISLQLYPHWHHIVTPRFVDRPHWSDCTSGQMDGEATGGSREGRSDSPPPISKGHGSGQTTTTAYLINLQSINPSDIIFINAQIDSLCCFITTLTNYGYPDFRRFC